MARGFATRGLGEFLEYFSQGVHIVLDIEGLFLCLGGFTCSCAWVKPPRHKNSPEGTMAGRLKPRTRGGANLRKRDQDAREGQRTSAAGRVTIALTQAWRASYRSC